MQSTQKTIERKIGSLGRLRAYSMALIVLICSGAGRANSSEFIDPERYLVGPDDEFTVSFLDASITSLKFSISLEGVATIPNVGVFNLNGSTLQQAKEKFSKKLKSQYSESEFDIALTRVRTKQMLVAGAVNRPGLYEISATALASELIKKAGGLARGASQRNIVIRTNQGEISVDLAKFLRAGEIEANPPVYLGEALFVPLYTDSAASQYVSGEVRNPGAFEFTGRDNINDLLALAGGLNSSGRADSVIVFNGAGEMSKYATDSDVLLGPQSRIMALPLGRLVQTDDVTITGEVALSGRYPLTEGMTIGDLIDLAGGVTPEAYRAGVTVYNTRAVRDRESDSLYNFERAAREESGFASPLGLAGRSALRVNEVYDVRRSAWLPIVLLPGDSVYAPRFEGLVNIIGQVARPGTVEYSENSSLSSLLSQAGGITSWADMSRSYVRRKNGGWSIPLPDAGRIFDGDMIFVARKANQPTGGILRTLRDISLTGAGVALTALAINELSK